MPPSRRRESAVDLARVRLDRDDGSVVLDRDPQASTGGHDRRRSVADGDRGLLVADDGSSRVIVPSTSFAIQIEPNARTSAVGRCPRPATA